MSTRHAMQAALLKSERLRILCVLAFVISLLCAGFIRMALFGFTGIWAGVLVALFVLAFVETAVLWVVDQATHANGAVPSSVWIVSVVAETCVPALCIAFLVNPTVAIPYRALATPWVLVFFPLITLSTLRMKPWFCALAGSLAAGLYLAAAYYHGWRPALTDPTNLTATQTAVTFYAVILLASGFVAGVVAGQIRKYVEATLADAEMRHQFKQVQHDLEIARSIQQSLLPQVRPRMNGFEIAGWNRSADSTGGDFFDWHRISDDRLVITLADVTGHGIGPALLAAVCRAYSRASFNDKDSLVVTMQRINRLLAADLTPARFATLVAVACNENDNTLELLSAGQGPLFQYSSRSGTFNELPPHSIPLGLMPEIYPGHPAVLSMDPGDILLLITDGFFEWENRDGDQFGVARVTKTIQRVSNLNPEEIIAELYRSVLEFADGAPQQDDLTAIVIKRVAVTTVASDKDVTPSSVSEETAVA